MNLYIYIYIPQEKIAFIEQVNSLYRTTLTMKIKTMKVFGVVQNRDRHLTMPPSLIEKPTERS